MEKLRELVEDLLEDRCYVCRIFNPQHKDCTSCGDMEDYRERLAEATNKPKHETVKQWEARTGETYPGLYPVWYFAIVSLKKREYQISRYRDVKKFDIDRDRCIVFNPENGKPDSIEG
jgi:hypothetical protein